MPHDAAGVAHAAACSGGSRSSSHRSRPRWRVVLLLGAVAVSAAMVVPRLDELPGGLAALVDAHRGWLLVAVALATLPFVGAAVALQGAVPERLPFVELTRVQVAGAFATAVAPAGLANLALNARYLICAGVARSQAAAAVLVARTATTVLHLVLLVALFPVVSDHLDVGPWPRGTAPGVGIAGALLVGAALVAPVRRSAARLLAPVGEACRAIAPTPTRLGLLVVGSMAVTLTRAVTMYACLLAMEVSLPVAVAVGLFLAAEAAGAVAATPAGLGVLDGVLLAGLVTSGVAGPAAVGAVLLFRLLTFWVPLAPGAVVLRGLRRVGAV